MDSKIRDFPPVFCGSDCPDTPISLPQPQAEAVVPMIEMNECRQQRFHIALLSSAFNDSYYSSNCVVIVTANSHLAICVSLFGLCQPTFIQINPTLCSAVIACYFSLPDAPFFLTDFPNDAWLLSVCRVLHANPTPPKQGCAFVYVYMSYASFLNACSSSFLFGNAFFS